MTAILGPEAAEAALDHLLTGIRADLEAAKGRSAAEQRQAASTAKQKLRDFVKSTQPQNPGDPAEASAVDKVDQVAFEILIQLGVQQLEQDIRQIEAGATKLRALAGSLGAETTANVQSAASIGLKPVKQAIESMTALVGTVKQLKANLKAGDPDQARIAAEIDRLATQFETLRRAVNGAAG